MNDRLKEAFDGIHAEEELKDKTRAFLAETTNGYQRKRQLFGIRRMSYGKMAAVMACFIFLFLGVGGWKIYFTPVSSISIDVNPSMELGVNRLDTVISVKGYNNDGQALLDGLDIKYSGYADALDKILADDTIQMCLARNEEMAISVTGTDEEQSQKILEDVEARTSSHGNIHCYKGNYEITEAAHEAGFSTGKYQVFLELQKLNPDLTAEKARTMTMRQLRDMMSELLEEENDSASDCEEEQHAGAGNGAGNGNGVGNGNSDGNGNRAANGTGTGSGKHNGHGRNG